jgi:hypothetical protein
MAWQMEPLPAFNIEYLRTRQDRRDGWGLIPRRAPGKLRGLTVRRPFTMQPQSSTFEGVHASLAERRRPDADCVPKPYDCPGLAGIDFGAKLMDLSALEQQLRLTAAPVGVPPAPPEPPLPQPTSLDRDSSRISGAANRIAIEWPECRKPS